jgi:hypothetical protein
MTDSDVLVRAAKALREAHTGERQGSGFTRARVMSSLHRDRRRRLLRWAVISPLASVLLVGSAWAQSTGKWPVLWNAVASVFVSSPAPEKGEAPPVSPKPPAPSRAEPLAAPAAIDAGPAPAENTPGPALEEPAPERPRAARKPARSRRKGPGAAQPEAMPEPTVTPEPPPEPARDRELSRFREAHDLHFGGRAREAIQAYDAYLRAYPNGRFVPEARYNGALDQIELGNTAAAREALEPFAAGRYGNYRRKEARQLLDALR